MRGKAAKKLRKIARDLQRTIPGDKLPASEYSVGFRIVKKHRVYTGVINTPGTVRSINQNMKHAYRRKV